MLSLKQHRQLGLDVSRSASRSQCLQHGVEPIGLAVLSLEKSALESDSDESTADATSPRTWPLALKYRSLLILFWMVFTYGWVSSCDSNTSVMAAMSLGVSEEVESLATALFMLGIALGSLLAGPVSESFGRNPAYLISGFLCLVFILGAGFSWHIAPLLVCKILAGICSSPALSTYGGTLADLFDYGDRSLVWPIFALSPILGPVLAPLMGGWIKATGADWRWVYWIGLALASSAWILAFFFLPETYKPVLKRWQSDHERDHHTRLHGHSINASQQYVSLAHRLWENLQRPAKYFTTEPIIIFLGLYLIIISAINFAFLKGFSFIFGATYRLPPTISELGFVCISGGALLNTALTPLHWKLHAYLVRRGLRLAAKDDAEPGPPLPSTPSPTPLSMIRRGSDLTFIQSNPGPPELRLVPALIASPFLPISLFWLGWTNFPSIHPVSGYLATVMFGYSLTAIFISSYQYIIDSYETYSSSALASITAVRYMVSAGMIVASWPMYSNIGVQWSCTIEGCLGVLMVPAVVLLYVNGTMMRRASHFASQTRELS